MNYHKLLLSLKIIINLKTEQKLNAVEICFPTLISQFQYFILAKLKVGRICFISKKYYSFDSQKCFYFTASPLSKSSYIF